MAVLRSSSMRKKKTTRTTTRSRRKARTARKPPDAEAMLAQFSYQMAFGSRPTGTDAEGGGVSASEVSKLRRRLWESASAGFTGECIQSLLRLKKQVDSILESELKGRKSSRKEKPHRSSRCPAGEVYQAGQCRTPCKSSFKAHKRLRSGKVACRVSFKAKRKRTSCAKRGRTVAFSKSDGRFHCAPCGLQRAWNPSKKRCSPTDSGRAAIEECKSQNKRYKYSRTRGYECK